jgi:hypothetical protein
VPLQDVISPPSIAAQNSASGLAFAQSIDTNPERATAMPGGYGACAMLILPHVPRMSLTSVR